MFRTASPLSLAPGLALALALALPACSGGEVPVGKTDQQLQKQKNGQPTGDGSTCSWAGTSLGDTATSTSSGVTSSSGATSATTHAVGDKFKSLDGCNDCTCTTGGITCTERACTPADIQPNDPGSPGGVTVDQSKLGSACEGADHTCPEGQSCTSFPAVGLRCAANACAAVTCPSGQQCIILETFPSQVRCAP